MWTEEELNSFFLHKGVQFIVACIATIIIAVNLGNQIESFPDYSNIIPLIIALFFLCSWLFKICFIKNS